MSYKAVIAGASGLIGSSLVEILLAAHEYDEVVILVRKTIGLQHKKLVEIIVDFDKLEDYKLDINGRAIFCCLGTTNNKTPDKVVYRKIDHDYPLKLAKIGVENQVDQYHLVSSLGANSKSAAFYTKLKGETEEDIKSVGLKTLHIYRPSLLTGERKESRILEKLITKLFYLVDPLLVGRLRKYRSIPAKTVAMAMYKQSIINNEGVFTHLSDKIKQIA